jgi:alpha-tubulin suppressor-like RCC1 family protein
VLYGFGNNERGQLGYVSPLIPQLIASNIRTVCFGPNHAVIVTNNNDVFSWGVNNNQLGQNTTASVVDVPVKIANGTSLPTITSVACGSLHTLLLSADSRVFVFGSNQRGQLGSNNPNPVLTVQEATWLYPSATFTNVYANDLKTFGLNATSTAFSFGSNQFGQLGLDPSITQTSTPQIALGNVQDIFLGADFNLLLGKDGKVYSFGNNQNGQLGLNITSVTALHTPSQITFLPAAASIVAAGKSSALIYSGNNLYGFGNNDFGQLGLPVAKSVSLPTQVDISMMDSAIVKISTGDFSLVLTATGKVYSAGKNQFGQLGIQSTADFSERFQLVTVVSSIQTPITSIYATGDNAFFVTNDNKLYGYGSMGKLGYGFIINSPTLIPTNNVKLDRVFAGYQFTFSYEAKTGAVYSWGRNEFRIMNLDAKDRFLPYALSSMNGVNVTDISVGGGFLNGKIYYTVYMLRNDSNAIYGTGLNDDAQMATVNTTDNTIPPLIAPPAILPIGNETYYYKVEAGAKHCVVLASPIRPRPAALSLNVWGANTEGQIGLSTETFRYTKLGIRQNVKDVASGDFHTIFVDTANRVFATGLNDLGQIGLGNLGRVTSITPIASLNTNETVTAIYAGSASSFIVTEQNLYVMGDNTRGTLGIGSDPANLTTILTPVLHPFFKGSDILKISSAKQNGRHTLVLTRKGELYVMGLNDMGQLGLGDFNNRFTPVKVTMPNNQLVLDITAGTDHSVVVTGSRSCPNNCNGNRGICDHVIGACNCFTDFTGFDCGLFNCPDPICSGHGTCNYAQGQCKCDSGFNGDKCQNRRCPNNCSGNGKCNRATGICDCDKGWQGSVDCSKPSAATRNPVSSIICISSIILGVLFMFL